VDETTYAAITPARNEADNLPRVAESLAGQTAPPARWLIVDNGSTDATATVARALSEHHGWAQLLSVPGDDAPVRGAPIVRALHAGIEALVAEGHPSFVVSIDADISFAPDYFERLLAKFAQDARLGIASGTCYELEGDAWRQRHVTGSTVWGASRMYRWTCLEEVLPLEERFAWDGIDEIKANARGWRTTTFVDLPFRHHRPEGVRDESQFRARASQGRAAHYMGYRPWYIALRGMRHMLREPAALGLIWGYAAAELSGAERCPDVAARAYLRSQQSIRRLPRRVRETLAHRRTMPTS